LIEWLAADDMLTFLILALVGVAVNSLRLRCGVLRHEQMQILRSGWLSVELWRHASLIAHRDISGGKSFPLPQETRTLLWRFAGLPVRCQVRSLGLPNQVTDQIGRVDGAQFDALFPPEFRRTVGVATNASPRTGLQRAHFGRL
jgi:hypothetical protein